MPTSNEFFQSLSAENIQIVDPFYDSKILFMDPLGEINGLAPLRNYYSGLYQGVESIRFEFTGHMQ